MIVNQRQPVLSALQVIEASKFEFHLTGSRYFLSHTTDSDYDFFVEYVDGLLEWLGQNQFQLDSSSYPEDLQMVKVYRRDNVHVQVVNCAKIRVRVQHRLYHVFRELKPTKEQAKMLWSLALRLYVDGMDGRGMGLSLAAKLPLDMF
jgi:hypothetical protein